MVQVFEIFPHGRQGSAYRAVTTMAANDLVTQGARTSADMVFTLLSWNILFSAPGPWFNIKLSSYQHRKSHCGDKTILRPSYLHIGISYTGKMSSLYWIGTQRVMIYHSSDHFVYASSKWETMLHGLPLAGHIHKMILAQSPWKLLGFYQTMDEFGLI